MIISFRCSQKLKQKIDEVIDAGLYPDLSSFCSVALENQLLLEENHNHDKKQGKKSSRQKYEEATPSAKSASVDTNYKQESSAAEIFAAIPDLLSIIKISPEPPFSLSSTYPDIFQANDRIPIDRWLFGQYNRLLPAKISMRALAALAMKGKESLALEDAAPKIAEVAAKFGGFLQSLDRRFGTHRDEALFTAFPEEAAGGQKGRVRYQNHFVGQIIKGEQSGLLVGLKLAVIILTKNKPFILPTTAGWDFARLSNPLMDASINDPIKFSDEEIHFLLSHIKEHVPVELFAYQLILSMISEGKATPEALNEGLAQLLPSNKTLGETQDFLSTQRTGALGRMNDLGLVTRQRQGTRITYGLSSRGREFLKEIEPAYSNK